MGAQAATDIPSLSNLSMQSRTKLLSRSGKIRHATLQVLGKLAPVSYHAMHPSVPSCMIYTGAWSGMVHSVTWKQGQLKGCVLAYQNGSKKTLSSEQVP